MEQLTNRFFEDYIRSGMDLSVVFLYPLWHYPTTGAWQQLSGIQICSRRIERRNRLGCADLARSVDH
jgi:hypothetical protein